MVMAMHYIPDVATWMALLSARRIHGKRRWQSVSPNEFLKCSLTMLLVMCCCQTCMLLLAKGIFVRMLNGRERKEVGRNSSVAPGLK